MDLKKLKVRFEEIKDEVQKNFSEKMDETRLEELRIKYLSKKGLISAQQKLMKEVDDKKEFGKMLNDLKANVEKAFHDEKIKLDELKIKKQLKSNEIDVTLPASNINVGTQNLLIKTAREVEKIFESLGFEIQQGFEIESDFYNFEALNLPEHHPARDMQDTFYINEKLLLRTHTSNSQARTLNENTDQNFKIITPGKVYRKDDDDATHSHQFMQVEGLVVVNKDEEIYASLRELKTILTLFMQRFFERDDIKLRMRPSYFPFTEPSVEVDITCTKCSGEGCSICKRTGWIEVLGSGVVHKRVLEIGGYDPNKYSGYAFGIGVERLAMLKYSVDDIRIFYQNDYRFLKQFK